MVDEALGASACCRRRPPNRRQRCESERARHGGQQGRRPQAHCREPQGALRFRIEDTWEAGIQLTGTEVKSLRAGQANIAESYASAENGGIFLINAYIPEYKAAGAFFQHEPRRPRRLLLHKKRDPQARHRGGPAGHDDGAAGALLQRARPGETELALAQGKKLHDKREDTAKRDWQRQKARLLRGKG